MAAHHDLPLDVLRLLLEFSASTSLTTARTLSLVSKNVQHWTDPHLYRIVEGDSVNYSRSERYGVPSVERLCSSDASPRIVLARHLRLCCDMGAKCAGQILSSNFFQQVAIPAPPLYRYVLSTHLALTFMALESEHDTGLAFSRIRGTFPPSLILCLFDLAAPKNVDPGKWFTEMAYTGLKVDDRIVLCSEVPEGNPDEMVVISLRDTFQEWCGVQDGVQTFWDLGESVLKGRQGMLWTA
ncbi:hypothetical protein DL96DRAFT_1595829 [Flagelloscypha sp. PMI_526]|nr:hypothetical protein DL96DRAFT_1595829 [Flagelloscypha sp. PMI_526]